MHQKVVDTPFPLIDSDPHASRVVRYFRPSDYAAWGVGTAAFPAGMILLNKAGPTPGPMGTALRLATVLGFGGGFLWAYQRSSLRFWGWTENEREQAKDLAELSKLAAEGKPLYGEGTQTPYIQGVAHRNSVWSQLKMGTIPWFNVVDHPYHGVDTAKYYEAAGKNDKQ